jgi:MFS family permease
MLIKVEHKRLLNSETNKKIGMGAHAIVKVYNHRHVLTAFKIVGMLHGLVMMAVAGTLYCFSVYSESFKLRNGYTQAQVNLIIGIGNIGVCIGSPAGFVFDKFGPRITSFVATVLTLIGYMLLWASLSHHITTHYIFMCFVYFLIGQGNIFTYMPALLTQVKNFSPKHRGKVVGLIDSMYGLSSGIFAAIYSVTYGRSSKPEEQDLPGFTIFLAITLTVVNVLGILLLRIVDHEQPTETNIDEEKSINAEPVKEVDITGWKLLISFEFWLMTLMFSISVGIGLLYLNNIGYMLVSLRKNSLTPIFAIALPVGSCGARFVVGFVSDFTIKKLSRASWQFLALLILLITQLVPIFAMKNEIVLVVCTVLVGCSFGMLWCITPTLVSELFGIKYFGTNWGGLILGSAIAGLLYQRASSAMYEASIPEGVSQTCYGVECWRTTFVVTFASSIVCAFMGLLLVLKTKSKSQIM